MKKFQKIIALGLLALVCTSASVFAVPVKEDAGDSNIQITIKDKETSSPKASAKATAKATSTATAKASEDEEDKIVLDSEEGALVVEATSEPTLSIENNTQQLENKKYLTKGGAFLWFLFTVLELIMELREVKNENHDNKRQGRNRKNHPKHLSGPLAFQPRIQSPSD